MTVCTLVWQTRNARYFELSAKGVEDIGIRTIRSGCMSGENHVKENCMLSAFCCGQHQCL